MPVSLSALAPKMEEEAIPSVRTSLDEPEAPGEEADSFFLSGAVNSRNIDVIAKKYGVPREELVKHAYLRGGTVEGESNPLLYLGALAGEALPISGGAITAFAQKKGITEDKRAAFDLVADLVEEKKSTGRTLGEIAIGIASPIAAGAKVKAIKTLGELAVKTAPEAIAKVVGAKSALARKGVSALTVGGESAALGAGVGVTQSKEGEELPSALMGAAVGGALGGVVGAIAGKAAPEAVAESLGNKTTKEIIEEGGKEGGKLSAIVDEAVEKNREKDNRIIDLIQKIDLPEDAASSYQTKLSLGKFSTSTEEELKARGIFEAAIRKYTPEERLAIIDLVEKEGTLTEGLRNRTIKNIGREYAGRSEEEMLDALSVRLIYEGVAPKIAAFTNEALSGAAPSIGRGLRSPSSLLGRLGKMTHDMGSDGVLEKFEGYRKVLALEDDALRARANEMVMTNELSGLSKLYDKTVNPARFVANKIDRKLGTNLSEKLDDIIQQLNYYRTSAASMQPKIIETITTLADAAKRTGLSKDEVNSLIYKQLDGHKLMQEEANRLQAIGPSVVKKVADTFEEFRQTANKLYGEEVIKKWGDETGKYVYHTNVDFRTAVKRILNTTDELAQMPKMKGVDTTRPLGDVIKSLGDSPEAQKLTDLREALEWMTGKKFVTVDGLFRGLEYLKSSAGSKALGDYVSRSAIARVGQGIPSLIRETDIVKLQEKWLMTNLKGAALASPLRALLADVRMLAKVGDKHSSEYFGNLIQDLQYGAREGTMIKALEEFNKAAQISLLQKAKEAQSKFGRKMWETLAEYPEMFRFLLNQMYPAVLSAVVNPMATIVNLTQTMMYTIPEVGEGYGTKLWIKALYTLSKNKTEAITTRRPTSFFREMYERGFIGAEWSGQLLDMMEEATSSVRSEMAKSFGKYVNKVNRVTMWPFSQSEFINRAFAFDMGKTAAKDLVSAIQKSGKDITTDEAAALKLFQNLPDAYKRRIAKQMRSISPSSAPEKVVRDIEDSIIKHLIGKTIFNYDKASASQVSREVAPVFMTFMKFPMNVMGDVVDTFERKGAWKGGQDIGRRFLLPHMGLFAMDEILKGLSDTDRMKLEQALEGDDPIGSLRFFSTGGSQAGLRRYSLAGSLGGLMTGAWASPPGLALARVGGYTLGGDWNEAKKAAKDSYKFLFPAPFTNAIALYDTLANAGIVPPVFDDE